MLFATWAEILWVELFLSLSPCLASPRVEALCRSLERRVEYFTLRVRTPASVAGRGHFVITRCLGQS